MKGTGLGTRGLFALWRRSWLLGLGATVAVLLLPAMGVFLWFSLYAPVLAGTMDFIIDFSFFYRAAERFVADPLALYPGNGYGFMYPPPSVVLFLPLLLLSESAAFMLWEVVTLVLTVVNVGLALRLYERATGRQIGRAEAVALLLVGLALAPTFQHLRYGQVNMLVLASGLSFLVVLGRERPFWAALLLSLGFWLKLYPLALAPLGLRRSTWKPYLAGFAVGLVGVPILLLPLIPGGLYAEYVLEIAPHLSGVTRTYALNESIVGVVTRMSLPLSDFLHAYHMPVGTLAKTLNGMALLGLIGGTWAAYFTGRLRPEIAGFFILALLPVTSQLGWEHTYVLALPLVLLVLLEVYGRGLWAQMLVAAGLLMLFVPKPPDELLPLTFAWWPRPVVDLFYSRFLLVTLAFLALAAVWAWPASVNRQAAHARRGRPFERTRA